MKLVTLKAFADRKPVATPTCRGCEKYSGAFLFPGFQSKPWARICERFQRYE